LKFFYKNKKNGFTIIEILIAFSIFAIIMTGVAQMQGRLSQTYSKTNWSVNSRNKLRASFLILKTYIEKSNYLTGITDLGSFYLSVNNPVAINVGGTIDKPFFSFEGYVPDRYFLYRNSSGNFSETVIDNSNPTNQTTNLFEFFVCEPYENLNGVIKNPSRTRFNCYLKDRKIYLKATPETGVARGFYIPTSTEEQSASLVPNTQICPNGQEFERVLFDEVVRIVLDAKEIKPAGLTLDKNQRDNASEMKYFLNWQKKGIFTMKVRLEMQQETSTDVKASVEDEFTVEVPIRVLPDVSL
jgi:prepilin-type N-terminal cleavage/methylation domain-containing protein